MGWSIPEVPVRAPAASWSPWVCLFIILFGVFIGLAWAIFSAPAGGLAVVSSGTWLPLTGVMLISILAAIALYLLWWEAQALATWYWNSWRLNMLSAWQQQAHQHLCVVSQVVLTPDAESVPRIIGLASQDENQQSPSTLRPDEILVPGMSRFEMLCRLLIVQATSSLPRWYPTGNINVVIQTPDDPDISAEEKQQRIVALWSLLALPWNATIEMLPTTFPFEYWNEQLAELNHPLLVLALHYRQPGETQTEFASALLLSPPALLPCAQRNEAMKLFRAMPLNMARLTAELQALQDMGQQPTGAVRLVWFSGLTAPQSQLLAEVVRDLPLALSRSAPGDGVIDFDKRYKGYGHLTGWLMATVASEATHYDMGGHWMIWADDKQAWAMAAGIQEAAVLYPPEMMAVPPFPAGGIMCAVLLHLFGFWFLVSNYSDGLFSWWGVACASLVSGIALPGIALVLRKIVAWLLLPGFIHTAGEQTQDGEQ